MNKKILLTALIYLFLVELTFAQFKYVPSDLSDAPQWAQMMYSGTDNYYEVSMLRDQYYRTHSYSKDIHERNFRHWTLEVSPYLDENGVLIHDRNFTKRNTTDRGDLMPWEPIGPMETYNLGSEGGFPVSWQSNVYCMDACVQNPDILVAGIEGGDVFKTTDKGLNWFAISENISVTSPQAIAIAPSDCDRIYFYSNNTFHASSDGGDTWTNTNFTGSFNAYEIEVHDENSDVLFIAGSGGLKKSEDGGNSFIDIQSNKCWDVKYHPNDVDIIYCLLNDPIQKRTEFFKSINGGDLWAQEETGWYFPEVLGQAEDIGGKIGLSEAAPEQIYVALIGQSKEGDNGWIGLYKSEDAGVNWTLPSGQIGGPYDPSTHQNLASINTNGTGFHQGFYNFAMAVSQNDPDRLWVGCLSLSLSQNGGESFERIGGYSTGPNDIGWIHPDCQDMVAVGDDIWIATDGGLNYSNDELTTHESRKFGIYNSTFWGFNQGWNQDILVGGRYHNGNSGYFQTYEPGYHLRLGGAEAATGYVNPLHERKVYFSDITDHFLPEFYDQDKVNTGNLGQYPTESYWTSESSEIEFDPRYAEHMYMGRDNKIWKSVNEGSLFEELYSWGITSKVYEIEVCRQDPNRLYAVIKTGAFSRVYKSYDQGESWEILPQDPSNSIKMEIAVNPANDDELWGFEVNSSSVFKTTDGGDSWIDMTTPALAGNQIRDIQVQGGSDLVYISTNTSVYYWDANSSEWMDMGLGLPAQMNVLETRVFYRDSKLRLVDGGKGIWETELIDSSEPLAQAMTQTDVIRCSRDTVQFDCFSMMDHQDATWNWNFVPEPIFVSDLDVRNPKVVFGGDGVFTATLEVVDGNLLSSTSTISVEVINECEVEPYPGLALECNNDGDYASTSNLNRTTENFTISAWVKPDGIQPDYSGIVMNNGIAAGINFREGNNTLGYHWPNGQWWFDSNLIVEADQWSHVAMVVRPDTVSLYVNGVGVDHLINISPVQINTMLIGSYQGWAGRNFNGLIDEVRIYDRSLSLDELRELRHLTLTQEQAEDDPSVLAYYQFNELEGDILDRSGLNHASLSGGAFRENSGGPFGGGASDRFDINATGNTVFIDPEVTVEFNEGSQVPNGEVVISRILLDPNILPGGLIGYQNYFIINNYGLNENFELDFLGLGITDFVPSADQASLSSPIHLFSREENSDVDDWIELCTATTVADGLHWFTDCPITEGAQFYSTSDVVVGIEPTAKESHIAVFPNPVLSNGNIIVSNGNDERSRFLLFNSQGQLIGDQWIDPNSDLLYSPKNLAAGTYLYTVQGESFIKNGRIVIQ